MKKDIMQGLSFVAIVLGVWGMILLPLYFLMMPEQTEENTFNWDEYENTIIDGNVAKLERDFTGGFYVTGKVVYFGYVSNRIGIIRENDEDRTYDVLLVTMSESDAANLNKGDIITVYNKFKVRGKSITGTSGSLIEIIERRNYE